MSIYDAAGLRVAEKVNDVWRFLIYDIGGKLVAEYGGVQATDEGGVKYVLQDWQGSTRAVLGNTGNVQSRSDYTAFGEPIGADTGFRTAAQGYGKPGGLRQGYALTEKDDATGLDHTWFRKNENQAGRWTSPDPYNGSMSLGNPQSFNRYSYVENDPVNWVDPNGLQIAGPNTYYGPVVQGYGAFNGGLAGLVYFMAQAQHAYEQAIINNLSQVLSEIPFPIYYSQLGEFLFTFFSLQVNVTTSTITFVSGEPRLYPFDSPDGPAIDPPQQGGEVIFGGYNLDRVVPSRISQTARACVEIATSTARSQIDGRDYLSTDGVFEAAVAGAGANTAKNKLEGKKRPGKAAAIGAAAGAVGRVGFNFASTVSANYSTMRKWHDDVARCGIVKPWLLPNELKP